MPYPRLSDRGGDGERYRLTMPRHKALPQAHDPYTYRNRWRASGGGILRTRKGSRESPVLLGSNVAGNRFATRRHLISAAEHRYRREQAFTAWRIAACSTA